MDMGLDHMEATAGSECQEGCCSGHGRSHSPAPREAKNSTQGTGEGHTCTWETLRC